MRSRNAVPEDGAERRPVVLVVDDHPDSAAMLAECVAFQGALAIQADNVAHARAVLASEERIDLVVTDYAMPDEDGLSLLARIRDTPSRQALPVVMVSGHDTHGEIAQAARDLGAEFVGKPFELNVLFDVVKRALAAAG